MRRQVLSTLRRTLVTLSNISATNTSQPPLSSLSHRLDEVAHIILTPSTSNKVPATDATHLVSSLLSVLAHATNNNNHRESEFRLETDDDDPHVLAAAITRKTQPLPSMSLTDAAAALVRLRIALQLAQPLCERSRAPLTPAATSPLAAFVKRDAQLELLLQAASISISQSKAAVVTRGGGGGGGGGREALGAAASLIANVASLGPCSGSLHATRSRLVVQLYDVGTRALRAAVREPNDATLAAALDFLRGATALEALDGCGAPPLPLLDACAVILGGATRTSLLLKSSSSTAASSFLTVSVLAETSALWAWWDSGAADGQVRSQKGVSAAGVGEERVGSLLSSRPAAGRYVGPRIAALKAVQAASAVGAAVALTRPQADAAASALLYAASATTHEGGAAALRALRALTTARAATGVPCTRLLTPEAFCPRALAQVFAMLGDGSEFSASGMRGGGGAG